MGISGGKRPVTSERVLHRRGSPSGQGSGFFFVCRMWNKSHTSKNYVSNNVTQGLLYLSERHPGFLPSFPLPRSLPPPTTKARPKEQGFHGQALELCDSFPPGGIEEFSYHRVGRNTGFSQCVWNKLQHSITNQNRNRNSRESKKPNRTKI